MIQEFCYEVSPDLTKYPIRTLTWDTLEDYTSNQYNDVSDFTSQEKMEKIIQNFLALLKKEGFKVGTVSHPTNPEQQIPYIKSNHIAKKNHFYPQFKNLKEKVAAMTFDDFMNEHFNEELESYFADVGQDEICLLGDEVKSFDSFIRTMENNKEYYIGIVLQIDRRY